MTLFLLLVLTGQAHGFTLIWDANTEPDLGGYHVHIGIASRQYTHSLNVGNQTNCEIDEPPSGESLYLAVTAYDIYGNESEYSEELVYTAGADSDGDGLSDQAEISVYLTDPADPDSDNDGVNDGWEVAHGYDPADACSTPYWEADTDRDGDFDGSDLAAISANMGTTDCYAGCGKDLDGDGDVDGTDFALCSRGCVGDLDHDGDVDGADLSILMSVVSHFHCK
jgi:hypothetical protein